MEEQKSSTNQAPSTDGQTTSVTQDFNQPPAQTVQLASPVNAPTNTTPHKPKLPLAWVLILLVAVVVSGSGGYAVGSKKSQPATTASPSTTALAELKVPQGATLLSECAKGRGQQYALPKDIPTGPVYNVHEGKVIGIEFMVGKDDLLNESTNFLNLPLYNSDYDHVNVGLLSQGHAGFPDPHYHVDIMMAPKSVTDTITCE